MPVIHLAWPGLAIVACLCSLLLLGAGQARGAETAAEPGMEAVKVYVSLPRQGDNANTSRLIVKGLRAALRSVDGRVAGHAVRLVQLDDSSGARWKAAAVRRNASLAVADPDAVAYVGELNSEATRIARPLLAQAQMAMFAPVATADSLVPELEGLLTRKRKPSLFRTIPSDLAQANAMVTYLRRSRVKRLVLLDDGALYGRNLADNVAAEAKRRGVRVLRRFSAHRDGRGRKGLMRRVASLDPQAVLFTGSLSSGAVPLFKALHRELPRALLFGGDALAHDSFARRVGEARSMVRLTRPAARINPRNRRLRRLLGVRPDSVTVFAFDGMMALLRAIKQTEPWDSPDPVERRAAIRDDLFSGRIQRGAVNPWVVAPNGNGSNGLFEAIKLGRKRVVVSARIALGPDRR